MPSSQKSLIAVKMLRKKKIKHIQFSNYKTPKQVKISQPCQGGNTKILSLLGVQNISAPRKIRGGKSNCLS